MKPSISKKAFEQNSFAKKGEHRTNVEEFLHKHKDTAYMAKEVARQLKLQPNTVHHSLQTLGKAKKILHKAPYYMWNNKTKK